MESFLQNLSLDTEAYVDLLTKLIGETEWLQNSPPQGLIPNEDRASDHVMKILSPLTVENGGRLRMERISYVEGRGNLLITLPGKTDKCCSFVGSHLDVVPANPINWDRNPFKLERDGDILYGRGTTDCLGHVALLTEFIRMLASHTEQLDVTIHIVFIANEENSSFLGVGVDQLAKEGHLDGLKKGPVFWIDSADSQPCMGTCGMLQWKLECNGKLFHSGLPHKGINSIEMATDAVSYLQKQFFSDFPRHKEEDRYNFVTCSTMKPTQIKCTPGSLNQLPPQTIVEGDIRLAPFYDVVDVKAKLNSHVETINNDPSVLYAANGDRHGPHSKYVLDESNGGGKGNIKLTWTFPGENGIACNIDSIGFAALKGATEKILGKVVPYSIGGSLPLVSDLQKQGFDVMIAGYGFSSKYHADNESVSIDSMSKALRILSTVVATVNKDAK